MKLKKHLAFLLASAMTVSMGVTVVSADELQKVTLKEMHWLCDGLSLNPQGAFKERHPKIIV